MMLRYLASATLAGALVFTQAAAQTTPPPDRAAGLLTLALAEGRAQNWDAGALAARRAGGVAVALFDWHRLRAGAGDWAEYPAFVAAHGGWPGLPLLMERGEPALAAAAGTGGATPAQVRAWFAAHAPETPDGALALAAAHRALGDAAAAEAEAIRIWRRFDLTADQQADLVARHGPALAPHHAARLDALLWRSARAQAEQLLPLMSPGHARLAAARLALREGATGVNALIDAVPADLAADGGMAHDRFAWRIRAQNYDGAGDLVIERSTSAEALGRPDAWGRWRAFLVRRALAEGQAARAYRLAAPHFIEDGPWFADLEWLAGFVALRHLNDPERALRHFQRLRVGVNGPISLGRAAYWEGRAHAAMGNPESARAAYAFGAEHQTSFYGLLAAEAAGLPMDPALAGRETFPDWRAAAFRQSDVMQAALMLYRAGDWYGARRFILHLAEGLDAQALGQLGDMALAMDEPNWAVLIAKDAAARGIILPRAYFPVTALAEMDLPVAPELALAIARRESEFDPAIVSPADARGLMQILPGTADLMATRLGITVDTADLTRDAGLNARLGSEYLAQLIEEFGTATILVAAGYNAGPGRPRRWIEELGDPRARGVDVIDWIEAVPFTETRNYIMRVMESVYVYRARLAGGPVPLRLSDELKGR